MSDHLLQFWGITRKGTEIVSPDDLVDILLHGGRFAAVINNEQVFRAGRMSYGSDWYITYGGVDGEMLDGLPMSAVEAAIRALMQVVDITGIPLDYPTGGTVWKSQRTYSR